MKFIKNYKIKARLVYSIIVIIVSLPAKIHAHSLIKTHLDPSLRTYSYPHNLDAQDYYFYPQGCLSPLAPLNKNQQEICLQLLAINGIEGIFFVPQGGITIVKQNRVSWTSLEPKIRRVFH